MKQCRVRALFALLLLTAVTLAGLSLFPGQAQAAPWPDGPVKIIVPYGAGGSSDAMARGLAKYWEKYLGVPIVVDNRPGAASQVGVTIYSRLPADGKTLLVSCQPYFSTNIIVREASYAFDQIELINIQTNDAIEIMVMDDAPYKTAEDLFKAIKENPGQLRAGYIAGGPQNIAAGILQNDLGFDFKHITYDGGNALRTALLGGHLDFMIGNGSGDISVAGKASALVILGQRKSKYFPEAPLFDEVHKQEGFAFPNLSMTTFVGVHSSLKEKHPDRYEKLVETYNKALQDPEYLKFLEESKQALVHQQLTIEESNRENREIHEMVLRYQDYLRVNN